MVDKHYIFHLDVRVDQTKSPEVVQGIGKLSKREKESVNYKLKGNTHCCL